MVSLSFLLDELETVKSELLAAQAHHTEVSEDVLLAKAKLETAKAERLLEGVDGKNAEAREATLRFELAETYAELTTLELELVRVRGRLDLAQTCFTSVRYKVRALEALKEVA